MQNRLKSHFNGFKYGYHPWALNNFREVYWRCYTSGFRRIIEVITMGFSTDFWKGIF